MGTKRAFEEDLQEFIKHPKHLDFGNKPDSFTETKLPLETIQVVGIPGENGIYVPDMVVKGLEINEPLPLVTGIDTSEDDSGPGPVFPPNLFSELFEYNLPRRPLFHYEDIYSSLLSRSPRKEIPIGPDHQADVPEFDPEMAKKYREEGGMERFLGVCVIPTHHSIFNSSSDIQIDCKCFDRGSIRCVQQHVKEARLNLKECYGDERFVDLGMLDMGEEVASRWSEEEERLFHDVVYSNPVSVGRMFWNQLAIAFPSRTKKELVSYYFNVFILRRRAIQNRAPYLDIDSDDDEWRGSYGAAGLVDGAEDDDFVVGDHDSFFEDGGIDGKYDDGAIGMDDKKVDVESSVIKNEDKFIIEGEQDGIIEEVSGGIDGNFDENAINMDDQKVDVESSIIKNENEVMIEGEQDGIIEEISGGIDGNYDGNAIGMDDRKVDVESSLIKNENKSTIEGDQDGIIEDIRGCSKNGENVN